MKRSIAILAGSGIAAALAVAAAFAADQPAASRVSQPAPTPATQRVKVDDAPPSAVMQRGTVRAIKLPQVATDLPPGPGRDTVAARCIVCHTLAYINIQPPFSRETWTAEVTKMQKTFSAPIPDDQIPEIVNYLVAVRGQAAK